MIFFYMLQGATQTNAALCQHLQQDVNVLVVAAGYKDNLIQWIGTNGGLKSRFPFPLEIPDSSEEELVTIGQE